MNTHTAYTGKRDPIYCQALQPPERSLDEVLSQCVRCGHPRDKHFNGRGHCKHEGVFWLCECSRFVGR
jgi:hypothetical protein